MLLSPLIVSAFHYQTELPVLLQELQPASTPLAVAEGSQLAGESKEMQTSPVAPGSNKGTADHVNCTCTANERQALHSAQR